MQDDQAQIESRVHLILSTSEDPHTAFCHSLLLSIPVICSIPSFQERNEEERLEFVIKFFQVRTGTSGTHDLYIKASSAFPDELPF